MFKFNNEIFRLSSKCSWQRLNDYVFIQNISTGDLFFLKGIAAELWIHIIKGVSLSSLLNCYALKQDMKSNKEKIEVIEQCNLLSF